MLRLKKKNIQENLNLNLKKYIQGKKEEEILGSNGWNNVYQQFITQNYNDPNEVQQLLNQIGGKKKKI